MKQVIIHTSQELKEKKIVNYKNILNKIFKKVVICN